MRLLYDLLFSLFALAYLPLFILKGKAKGGLGSRLGRVESAVLEKLKGQKVIWVHAVSVGEVSLALRLLNHWRKAYPGARFVLTTTTPAGREVALRSKHGDDTLLEFPVDFRFSVKRFVETLKPSAVVMMETEIWPNLVHELSRRRVPLFILNGRLSDRAIKKYRRVRFFLRPLLKKFTAIGAQDELMRGRFLELGARPESVCVTGNLKFDWEPAQYISPETAAAKAGIASDFLLVAASTHDGEDEILIDAFLALKNDLPGFGLLLAPRHLERLGAIESLGTKKGIRLKRVFTDPNNGYDDRRQTVWLLDRMGVLQHLYGAADAVFVGGSLVPVGGHNPVEPGYFAKPVLFGPRMNNFLEMSRLFLGAEAAFEVKDAAEIRSRILFLAGDGRARELMGIRAKNIVLGHQGALEKSTKIFSESTGDIWK